MPNDLTIFLTLYAYYLSWIRWTYVYILNRIVKFGNQIFVIFWNSFHNW